MLLEYVLSPPNLNKVYKQVKRNGGRGGVDNMDTTLLLPYTPENKIGGKLFIFLLLDFETY